jgi:diguanylate cyclase (GGDEF)-like protein
MGARILVVEGDARTRGMIGRLLVAEGHEVCEVPGAEQALDLLRLRNFSLVIADVGTGASGESDLRPGLERREPEALLVALTHGAATETATAAVRAGAYDYLTRPVEEAAVLAVVNRALDRIRLDEDNRALMQDLRRSTEELEYLNSRLMNMANRDSLTGLYHHRYFRESVEKEVLRARRYRRPFTLILLDIDHFRAYNDAHGHLAGDELLRTLSRLLVERCRASTLTARYGGEEFILLVPETDAQGARRFADALRRIVEEHPFVGRESQPLGRITLSAGIASYPEAGVEANQLVDLAERALRESKRCGRNHVTVWGPAPVPR